jgi:molybdopterin-binding protein
MIIPFVSSKASAQQLKMGDPVQENIQVRIDENGTAHVVHLVQGNSNSQVSVETIRGNITNVSVTDMSNNTVQYATIQQSPIAIMIPPSDGNVTIIRYDLTNVVSLNDGVWMWNYFTPSDTASTDFYFPSGITQIWANDRPVYIGQNGIGMHGDGTKLEYATENTNIQNIQWQNYTLPVEIDSLSDIGNYTFDQSTASYQFQISKPHSFVTVIMPKVLLGAKYAAHINGNHLLTTVFHENDTYAWIGLRPDTNGTIQITGSTVIPEFPLFLPLAIGISLILLLQFRVCSKIKL